MTATEHNSPDCANPSTIGAGFRRRLWAAVSLIFLALALELHAAPRAARFVPGRILVKPRAHLAETDLIRKLDHHRAFAHRTLPQIDFHVIAVPEENAEAALMALRNDPEIEFAERDFIAEAAFIPNDPYVLSGTEWHLARIHANEAWDFTAGRADTWVAVLDSGVNAALPDLAGRMLPGFNFVANDANTADDFGHGTAVAGTIVANGNNGAGVAGVAFGCRVLPVKVVDASGFATYSTIAQGIRYAVDQGARVINLSVAGDSPSAVLQDAVNYAWSHNVVIVAAAGNNADAVPQYPAACDHVVGVSATAPDDSLASFSSYGNYVTLSAPGDQIWTTQRDAGNPFGSWRGTSFSCPVVAGVAALVASENPALSNERIVSILKQTADDTGAAGYDPAFGFGRVNAFRAVAAAGAEPGALPPAPPSNAGITNGTPVPELETNLPPELVSALFAPVKGTYAGLVVNPKEVAPENSGFFSCTITTSGRFTGKLRLAGRQHGFRGRFDLNGKAVVGVKQGRANPLTLLLEIDLEHSTDRVSGRLTDGNWMSDLAGDRDVFSAKENPAPQAGRRDFILERAGDPAVTAAAGLSVISTSGTTRLRGRLDDGHGFAAGSNLAKNGDYPFYLSLKHGEEVVIGWLNFSAAPALATSGSVLWVRTGTNSFTATLQAAAAP